jgi:hypothetical protein
LSRRTWSGWPGAPPSGERSRGFLFISHHLSLVARNLSLILAACVVEACTDGEAERAASEADARRRVAAESARAAEATAVPAARGRWDEAHLVERLVAAGLAPQRLDSVRAVAFMSAPVLAFQLGQSVLHVYLYADSTTRQAITGRLDPAALAPAGVPSPWPLPRGLIVNANLAAILVGGTERQRERITNAIAAGLAAP